MFSNKMLNSKVFFNFMFYTSTIGQNQELLDHLIKFNIVLNGVIGIKCEPNNQDKTGDTKARVQENEFCFKESIYLFG